MTRLCLKTLAFFLPIHVIADMEVGAIKRHELSSEQWELIESSLRRPAPTGRPPKDRRVMLNGILWILRTGAPWRDLPERFGSWWTVYGYFQSVLKSGQDLGAMAPRRRQMGNVGAKA